MGASGVLLTIIANIPASVPTSRNGALGIPGISPSTMKTPAAVAMAFGENWSPNLALACLAPYAVGGIWALIVAARHWHEMTHTTDAPAGHKPAATVDASAKA